MTTFRSRRTGWLGIVILLGALAVSPALPATAAEGERRQRDNIFITKETQFNPANGVVSGTGTKRDPYIITGWDIGHVEIRDTNSYVEIYDNTIDRLVLDWIGTGRANVHDNDIGDLRVNQNRKRTGDPTSGTITRNRFGVVGQLRHFDGVFSHNVVGDKGENLWETLLWEQRAVNFDGFNGAVFENNVIYGYMDARLHGHHHSSGFDQDSHYHGAHADHPEMVDHSQRYHKVTIRNNTIYSSSGYALAYLDTAHAANDRTAASETNEELNKPHVHHTKVEVTGNKLVGSGFYLNIFNAKDERHMATAPGTFVFRNNEITLVKQEMTTTFEWMHGITVERAQDLTLKMVDNSVIGPKSDDQLESPVAHWWDPNVGILLRDIDKATLHLYGNQVANRAMGIQAQSMTKTVRWIVDGLKTENVEQDVYWDESVKNPPERRGSD
ncbi:MAG: hypothetical protein ABR575_03990 [Actinomycetota bacterium]